MVDGNIAAYTPIKNFGEQPYENETKEILNKKESEYKNEYNNNSPTKHVVLKEQNETTEKTSTETPTIDTTIPKDTIPLSCVGIEQELAPIFESTPIELHAELAKMVFVCRHLTTEKPEQFVPAIEKYRFIYTTDPITSAQKRITEQFVNRNINWIPPIQRPALNMCNSIIETMRVLFLYKYEILCMPTPDLEPVF